MFLLAQDDVLGPWISIITNVGLPLIIILSVGWFIYTQWWPIHKKKIEAKNDIEMELQKKHLKLVETCTGTQESIAGSQRTLAENQQLLLNMQREKAKESQEGHFVTHSKLDELKEKLNG